jgi:hypothetical protein
MTSNAAAALTYRARKALATAFLKVHVPADLAPPCRAVVDALPAWVRAELGTRQSLRVSAHLDTCAYCPGVVAELTEVNAALRAAPVWLIGGPALVAGGSTSWPVIGAITRWWRGIRSGSAPLRIAVGTGAAAAAAAAVAVAFALGHPGPHQVAAPKPGVTRSAAAPPAAPVALSPQASPARSASPPTGARTVPSPQVAWSTAPAAAPLHVTVTNQGAAQTFTLDPDIVHYSNPSIGVTGVPVGWRVVVSSTGADCAAQTCILRPTPGQAVAVTIDFEPLTAGAASGTASISLLPGAGATGTVLVSYAIELDT